MLAALAAWALGVAAPAAASDDPLTFQPFAAYGVGSDPESVAIADVTGDGRNDVLVSTSFYFDPENDGKLFVFAQSPDGNLAFTARLGTDGPSLGMGLGAGDLNGDGLADVALATANGVDLYFQESGHLVGPTLVPGTSSAMYVEVGDVTLDGREDLVIGLNGGGILFARNTGVAFDVSTATTQWTSEPEVGDVTGDGIPDIVGFHESTVDVTPQVGNGTFGDTVHYRAQA